MSHLKLKFILTQATHTREVGGERTKSPQKLKFKIWPRKWKIVKFLIDTLNEPTPMAWHSG